MLSGVSSESASSGYRNAAASRWTNEAGYRISSEAVSATSLHYEGYWLPALTDTVFVPASRRCTITINPKSACSTLKFNIWRQEYGMGASPWKPPAGTGGIHRKERAALSKPPLRDLEAALFDKPVFSIVRNPYTRLLSAYLDKIGARIKRPKRQLLVQMGRVEDGPVSFGEFVNFIGGQNSRQMNPHYAPQSFLMQVHYHPFSYIGCVEAMEESLSAIIAAAYDVKWESKSDFRPHRTDAASLIEEHFTDEIAAKVLDRFRVDFDIFGYDHDIAKSCLPPRNLKTAAQLGGRLAESMLRPTIRAEVAEERNDYATALELLSVVKYDEPELDVTRARLLTKLGRKDEALSVMQGVVQRVDNVGRYWMLLSECLLALKRREEAAEAADQAVGISPNPGIMRSAMRIWKANDRAITIASLGRYLRTLGQRTWKDPNRQITDTPGPMLSVKRVWQSDKIAGYKQRIASAEALQRARDTSTVARIKRYFNLTPRRR